MNPRYFKLADNTLRRKCRCGCDMWATHLGMVCGVCLITGCELSIRRWVRDGYTKAAKRG